MKELSFILIIILWAAVGSIYERLTTVDENTRALSTKLNEVIFEYNANDSTLNALVIQVDSLIQLTNN